MNDQFFSAQVVVLRKSKVLLVRHGKNAAHLTGVLGLPGGRTKNNESEKKGAIREVFEETGLALKENDLHEFPNNTYSAYIKRKKGPSGVFTMKVFMSAKFLGVLKKSDETEPVWIKLSDLDDYNLLPNVEKAINSANNYYKGIQKELKVKPDLA